MCFISQVYTVFRENGFVRYWHGPHISMVYNLACINHVKGISNGYAGNVQVPNKPIFSEHCIYLWYKTHIDIPTIYHVYTMYIPSIYWFKLYVPFICLMHSKLITCIHQYIPCVCRTHLDILTIYHVYTKYIPSIYWFKLYMPFICFVYTNFNFFHIVDILPCTLYTLCIQGL
jgi:hypothetical protein